MDSGDPARDSVSRRVPASGRLGGYVLAGGASSRMGRDKALLNWGGITLLERAASTVHTAAGNVTIVGDPARYSNLGFPVIPDRVPGLGPMGGLSTALEHFCGSESGAAEPGHVMLLACDMPRIDAPLLIELLELSQAQPEVDAVVPETPQGLQPLSAIYHSRILPKLRATLRPPSKSLKMIAFVETLEVHRWTAPEPARFANANTPGQFADLLDSGTGETR